MAELTYLANADPPGATNPFYALAKQYFAANGSTVVDAPPRGQTIEGILEDLRTRDGVQATVNIVCLATGFGALGMPVSLADQSAGRTICVAGDVLDALAKKSLIPPGFAAIDETTRIVFYGCDLGRSTSFLMLLSCLLGNPGEILAPRQLGVFTPEGSSVLYRQAQTWSLVKKAPLTPAGTDEPTVGWPAYREQFVIDASAKFGPAAVLAQPDGDTQLAAILDSATSAATTVISGTFFLETGIDISATATLTASQVAHAMAPMANGDPVTAAAEGAAQVDDTTVVTAINGSDAFPSIDEPTKLSLGVVMLAQLIDREVTIAEGPDYARVTSSQGLAPSLGPDATGSGSAAGTANYLQPMIDALLASGIPQNAIDELLAGAPQGDATEGIVITSPDAEPIAGDPDLPSPEIDIA